MYSLEIQTIALNEIIGETKFYWKLNQEQQQKLYQKKELVKKQEQ